MHGMADTARTNGAEQTRTQRRPACDAQNLGPSVRMGLDLLSAHPTIRFSRGATMDFLLCVMQTGEMEWTHRQFIGLRALPKLMRTAMATPVGGCLFLGCAPC